MRWGGMKSIQLDLRPGMAEQETKNPAETAVPGGVHAAELTSQEDRPREQITLRPARREE